MTVMNFTKDKYPDKMPRIVQVPNHGKNMNGSSMDLSRLKDNRFDGHGQNLKNKIKSTENGLHVMTGTVRTKLIKPVRKD